MKRKLIFMLIANKNGSIAGSPIKTVTQRFFVYSTGSLYDETNIAW
jgi:hypothetical protein